MARAPKKRVKRKEASEIDTEPDAWRRFTDTVGKVVPPKRPKPKDNKTTDKK